MDTRKVLTPNSNHPITISPNPKRVIVSVGGEVIADSRRTVTLVEAAYPAVHYIPREDVLVDRLKRSDHATYCPYKGDCSYFHIPIGGATSRNAVWTYESPYPAVAAIRNYLAFYLSRVDSISESDE